MWTASACLVPLLPCSQLLTLTQLWLVCRACLWCMQSHIEGLAACLSSVLSDCLLWPVSRQIGRHALCGRCVKLRSLLSCSVGCCAASYAFFWLDCLFVCLFHLCCTPPCIPFLSVLLSSLSLPQSLLILAKSCLSVFVAVKSIDHQTLSPLTHLVNSWTRLWVQGLVHVVSAVVCKVHRVVVVGDESTCVRLVPCRLLFVQVWIVLVMLLLTFL